MPPQQNSLGEVGAASAPGRGLSRAMLRGSLGFAAVSVAGFAVWACAGKWLSRYFGMPGLYLVCALAFIALSGLALHPLIRGPAPLLRFYKIFPPAFGAYALAWSAAWFAFKFGLGQWLGSLAGSAALSLMIASGFGNCRHFARVAIVMFVLHSAGYFGGERLMACLDAVARRSSAGGEIRLLANLSWGLLYGLGLGAGLGHALFTFQNQPSPAPPPLKQTAIE